MAFLKDIAFHVDNLLRTHEFQDAASAHNGLQLENNSGEVMRIAAAVDACEAVIDHATQLEKTLLIVHHGLFWRKEQCLLGAVYRKFRTAIVGDLAIYSAHLPLDIHPEHGNNILLARACGFSNCHPFLEGVGCFVGVRAEVTLSRVDLLRRVEKAVGGSVHIASGGPAICRHIGIISGAAGSKIAQAAAEGVDTLITGEGSHWTYIAAEEARVNLIYAGHYATETLGVQSVAKHLSKCFSIPWQFIDHPSGR